MNIITKTITPVLALGLLGFGFLNSAAQAAKIQGTIGLGGTATLNSPLLISATAVSNWGLVFAQTASGDFSSALSNPIATMNSPWVFSPSPGTPLAALWSVDGFTFDLTSSSVNQQTANFLDVTGYGIVRKAGFQDTDGVWTFSITSSSGSALDARFGFVASATSVPDGGSSVALLGFALVGVQFVRRRMTGGLLA